MGKAVAKAKTGRPTKYHEGLNDQAFNLALLGATDVELAAAFDVDEDTVNEWKKLYPEFSGSIRAGKSAADARVGRSLFDRANGFEWVEEQAFKIKTGKDEEKVEVVNVIRKVPPDTTACIFWLKNRRRTEWRDAGPLDGATLQVFAGIKIVIGSAGDNQGGSK